MHANPCIESTEARDRRRDRMEVDNPATPAVHRVTGAWTVVRHNPFPGVRGGQQCGVRLPRLLVLETHRDMLRAGELIEAGTELAPVPGCLEAAEGQLCGNR